MFTFGVLGLSCEAPAGPTLEGCLFFHAFFLFVFQFKKKHKVGQHRKTLKLAKVGLATVGHPNFGQSRSIKVGQSRSHFFWPKSVWPKSVSAAPKGKITEEVTQITPRKMCAGLVCKTKQPPYVDGKDDEDERVWLAFLHETL